MGLRRKCDMRILAVLGLVLLLLTGCMVGPDYERPGLDVPAAFRYEDGEAQQTANINWWKQFEDPALDRLIDEALASNRDVKIAEGTHVYAIRAGGNGATPWGDSSAAAFEFSRPSVAISRRCR